MRKKLIVFLVAATIVSGMFPGCGKSKTPPVSAPAVDSSVTESSASETPALKTEPDRYTLNPESAEVWNKEGIYPLEFRNMKSVDGNTTGDVLCLKKEQGSSNKESVSEGALSQERGTFRVDTFLHKADISETDATAYILEMQDMSKSYYEEDGKYSDIFQSPVIASEDKSAFSAYMTVKTDSGTEYQSFIIYMNDGKVTMTNLYWEFGGKDGDEQKAVKTAAAIQHMYGFKRITWEPENAVTKAPEKQDAKDESQKDESKKDESVKDESNGDESKKEKADDTSSTQDSDKDSSKKSTSDESSSKAKDESKKDESSKDSDDSKTSEKEPVVSPTASVTKAADKTESGSSERSKH